jgi:hypothetical protein
MHFTHLGQQKERSAHVIISKKANRGIESYLLKPSDKTSLFGSHFIPSTYVAIALA